MNYRLDATPQHRYPASYYAACLNSPPPQRPQLQDDLRTEICVVGAGFAGLYTALRLAEAGRKVVVLDGARVGWGASGRNGGQAILGLSCDMGPIKAALGLDEAREVWRLVREAAQEIRSRIKNLNIDCDWQDGHLWTSVLPRRVSLLTEWQEEAAHDWGYDGLRFIPKQDLPDWLASERYQAGLYDPEAGHLHPLKYLLGLAQAAETMGVQIYENSTASAYREVGEHVELSTAHGTVQCDQLVLACNVFLGDLNRERSRRILPVGTFQVATEPLGAQRAAALIPSRACVTDNQFVLDYFRATPDHRLLFGGGCTYLGGAPKDIGKALQPALLKVFPQLAGVKLDFAWGGLIDVTVRRTPDFGRRGNVYWAQGFSGHGVIPTCVAGRVLAEAILGNDEHLKRFMRLVNPPFPGAQWLHGPLEAAGKFWYRLRDWF
jgi:glycine/D-amino acid oxidase-like deaminating enzyme